ncbi:MAG TPA: transposase [Thermoguttaceae bacterium]|nr:transposase [Thermoguttaceae bacterium]
MSDYRRAYVPGGTFFFTVVTDGRRKLFEDAHAREILGDVMRQAINRFPTKIVAIVLLPDHLHTIWTLPPADADFSTRWAWIKKEFTKNWIAYGGRERPLPLSRQRERRHGVWQRRFWEHSITNEDDLEAHFDYIHYNPVKHGWVASPRDWPWSSFHRWVVAGHYSPDWSAVRQALSLPGGAGE